jgi:thermitase
MKAPIKTYIILTLSVISVLASWQGVQASSNVFKRGDVCNNTPSIQIEVPIQNSGLSKSEKAEDIALRDNGYPKLPQSQVQFNQYLESAPVLKQQWALERIQALPLPQMDKDNSQILVAVLDTGIDQDHDDLYGRVMAEINFTKSATTDDIYGHGTHIAGIIVARNDNNLGITGLAPESRLVNVKVADDKGCCQISALADGIVWAVDNGANVINISIEMRESSSKLREAVDYAWSNGAIIIAAAGNDGNEIPVYPACYENCIAVTAIQQNGTLAPLANYGDWVDVAAPGFDIYSTLPNNIYGYKHGTSFATAYVSGLAALLLPLMNDTNGDGRLNDEVRRAIDAGCHDIGIDGTGEGSINVTDSLGEVSIDLEYLS